LAFEKETIFLADFFVAGQLFLLRHLGRPVFSVGWQ
jgi:hypothetical protein